MKKILITESQVNILINEVRSNPSKNLHISIGTQITNFVKDKDPNKLLVSFRDKGNLYNTINLQGKDKVKGIYTYPWTHIKYSFDKSLNDDGSLDINKFMEDVNLQIKLLNHHMYIFEINDDGVVSTETNRDILLKYTKSLYKKYKDPHLKSYIQNNTSFLNYFYQEDRIMTSDPFFEYNGYDKTIQKSDLSDFYFTIKSMDVGKSMGSLLRECGIKVIIDYGTNMIHYAERSQAIIIDTSAIKTFKSFSLEHIEKSQRKSQGRYKNMKRDFNIKITTNGEQYLYPEPKYDFEKELFKMMDEKDKKERKLDYYYKSGQRKGYYYIIDLKQDNDEYRLGFISDNNTAHINGIFPKKGYGIYGITYYNIFKTLKEKGYKTFSIMKYNLELYRDLKELFLQDYFINVRTNKIDPQYITFELNNNEF